MIERLIGWHSGRSPREQRLLGIMMALLVIVIGWLGVLRPLDTGLAQARADQELAIIRLERVRSDVLALKTGGTAATDSAQALVSRLADQAGFSPTRLDPGAEGRVLTGLASAKPVALTRWLEALDAQGVFVEQISIRPNSDATLAVDATFRARAK